MSDPTHDLEDALQHGLLERDASGTSVCYRFVRPSDDLHAITDMLHAAYKPLADAGMRFFASHQEVDVTRARMERGETIVAVQGNLVVGTLTLRSPGGKAPAHYQRPDVTVLGQFAVSPERQQKGIGLRLLQLAEARARAKGAAEVAVDTSERAAHLIDWYQRCGYSFVEYTQWDSVNYRSVILSKRLDRR